MQEVIDLLKQAQGRFDRPTAQVAVSTEQFWNSLLFNEAVSDVRFRCLGDESHLIPAMKGILMASSDYFRIQLSGAWADLNVQDGIVDMSVPPAILKATLRFIYTGVLDSSLLEANTNDLLCAACEFMLEDMKQICEAQMAKLLTKETVREALVTAHLHSCEKLRASCYKFIKANPGVLLGTTFMSLAGEYPDLWKLLTVALGGNEETEKIGLSGRTAQEKSVADLNDQGSGEKESVVGSKRGLLSACLDAF